MMETWTGRETTKCLYPPCIQEAVICGLCRNHMSVAKKLIKSKATTREALIKAGKMARPTMGPRKSKLTEWFLSGTTEPTPKTPVEPQAA